MTKPLSPEELDKLQTVLVDQMKDVGCLPLDMVHGLLSAIAAGPREIAKEEWLPRVLGRMQDTEAMGELLGRFQEQLLTDLKLAEYGPLILQYPREDGSMLPLPYGWCQGYAAGLEMFGEEERDKALSDEQASVYLTPIFSFLMYEQEQYFDPPNETQHRETVGQLGDAAVAMFNWWNAQS